MSSNFGRFFSGIKKKKEDKQKVAKTKSTETTVSAQSDSDEDSYEDPTNAFPTEAPVGGKPGMPNYPPPRLNNINTVVTKKRDDYIEPYDSRLSGPSSPSVPPDNQDNYADPFDSKLATPPTQSSNSKNNASSEDDEYDLPYEASKTYRANDDQDNYSSPWDSKTHHAPPPIKNDTDNYSAPWDMARSISNNKKPAININKNMSNTQDAYSDPWDSKSSSSPMSQDAFDDTYSEPYDKGKMSVQEERKQRVKETLVEEEMGEFSEKEKRIFGINASREKEAKPSTPQMQVPAVPGNSGDYDAPWDWKGKNIEQDMKTMTIEVKSSPVSPCSPTGVGSDAGGVVFDEPAGVNTSLNTSSGAVHVPTDVNEDRNYEVDPTIPLPNQGWFHGRIRRYEAEKLLENDPDCAYLIRNSESSKIDYSLSLRNNAATIHLRISCTDGKYILGVNSRPFDTIPEMIHHYSMNKLNIRGAEQAMLKYPVLQEAVYFTVMPGS